uniref:Ionotropic glutamate receptor C-terminal domain-containing protein n=3 Tax=Lygus hesperus TaxID=30085 RepID=A0A146KUG9_LYGHE
MARSRPRYPLYSTMFPFVIIEDLEDGQHKLSGFVGDIWHTLEEHLGFKTQLVKDLKTARGWDVFLNPRELSLIRLARYSYTFPIVKIWYHLFARGKPSSGTSVAYIHIFDKNLWAVIFIGILVLSASLWGAWRVKKLHFDKHANQPERGPDVNYSTCILSVFGCMINQGSQFKTDRSTSIRIITLMCIVLGLIITTSFSALLISQLATVDESSGEPLDLESLAQTPRGRTLCVAVNSFAYRRIISHGDTEYLQKSTLKINSFPCTPGEHDIVPADDYCAHNAVILETLYNANHADPLAKSDKECIIYIYSKKYFTSHLILVVRKGFPFVRIINKYLLRMRESGLMRKLTEAWQPQQPRHRSLDPDSKSRVKLKVSFYHIKPLIVGYLCAVLFAWLVLAMEKLYKWW